MNPSRNKNFLYHFVYVVTNQVNGKYYKGKHSTNNLDDGYLGSGRAIKRAIKKYGKENFKREIVKMCTTEEEAYAFEKSFITRDDVESMNCYNTVYGGVGGPPNEDLKNKLSDSLRQYYKTHVNARKGRPCPRNAIKRTKAQKEHLSKLRKGEKNPMYGVRGFAHPTAKAVFVLNSIKVSDLPCKRRKSSACTFKIYLKLHKVKEIPAEDIIGSLSPRHSVGDNQAGRDISKFVFCRRFGFSASPIRNDGSRIVMEALFGPEILKMTYQESVDAGNVTPMKYLMLPCPKGPTNLCDKQGLDDVFKKRFGYWCNQYRNREISRLVYDIKQVYDGQILIMVGSLEHAIQLHLLLPWFKVAHYGATDLNEMKAKKFSNEKYANLDLSQYKLTQKQLDIMRAAFAKGTLRYVICTKVFKQGKINAPQHRNVLS